MGHTSCLSLLLVLPSHRRCARSWTRNVAWHTTLPSRNMPRPTAAAVTFRRSLRFSTLLAPVLRPSYSDRSNEGRRFGVLAFVVRFSSHQPCSDGLLSSMHALSSIA